MGDAIPVGANLLANSHLPYTASRTSSLLPAIPAPSGFAYHRTQMGNAITGKSELVRERRPRYEQPQKKPPPPKEKRL